MAGILNATIRTPPLNAGNCWRITEPRRDMLLRQCNESLEILERKKVFPPFTFVRVPRDCYNRPLPPFIFIQERIRENRKNYFSFFM